MSNLKKYNPTNNNFRIENNILSIDINEFNYLQTILNIFKYNILQGKPLKSSLKIIEKLLLSNKLYLKKFKNKLHYTNMIISNKKYIIQIYIYLMIL